MGRQKKIKFINKKNAQTFHVVHRSQRDPLQADEDSSKFVLQELRNLNDKTASDEKRKEEQREFGIFFEDDYDYTQHIQEVNPEQVWAAVPHRRELPTQTDKKVHFQEGDVVATKSVQLPPEVFPSEREEDIGLLNRAAPISGPRLDLDPDVVAAMDEDFDMDDPDNQLEDDFVLLAEKEGEQNDEYSDDEDGDNSSSGGEYDSDESNEDGEETRSRFTSYSLSSSVIRRNEGLTLLDDRFEKIYEEYDDMEMGALDHDEIEGHVIENSELLDQVLTEFEKSQKELILEKDTVGSVNEHARQSDGEEDTDNDDDIIRMKYRPKMDMWDCESIISTYSNLYNHPKIIQDPPKETNQPDNMNGDIKLSRKTGMPLGVLPTPGPTKKQLERQELEEYRLPLVIPHRVKGQKETLEQKKERKQAIKHERKARRIEKKTNKEAFKEEEKIQKKVLLNVLHNLQGVKVS